MYCYQCGTQLADNAKFCSGCGRSLEGQQATATSQANMATHITVLAWLFIGTAILYAIAGVFVLIAPNIIRNVVLNMPGGLPPDFPINLVRFLSSIAGLISVGILAFGAVNAAAGIGLLHYERWGRTLALVMSAIDLIKIPFGTALGIYGFWVLLSERGREYYERRTATLEGRSHA
jgi:hypothetical protein